MNKVLKNELRIFSCKRFVYIEGFLVSETAKTRPKGKTFNIAEFFTGMVFACDNRCCTLLKW